MKNEKSVIKIFSRLHSVGILANDNDALGTDLLFA